MHNQSCPLGGYSPWSKQIKGLKCPKDGKQNAVNRLSGSECTIKGGDGWERCEGRGGNGKGGSRARIQRGGGERGCGLGRAGRGVCLFLLLFVFFSGHSASMSCHVTRRPIKGAGGRAQQQTSK